MSQNKLKYLLEVRPQPMELDYNLSTAALRTEVINSILNSTTETNPHLLEYYTNYILSAPEENKDNKKHPQPTENSSAIDISKLKDILPDHSGPKTSYTNPKPPPLDWTSPELIQRHKFINHLKFKIDLYSAQGRVHDAYILRKLARELTMEGAYIANSAQPMPYAPIVFAHPIEWDLLIDWTNPFHIKQIIKLYSALKQSDYSWEIMEWVDRLCDLANLKSWQHHILLRTIDGANQITIGLELSTQFNRQISPSGLSQAKRNIYQAIAKAAAMEHLKRTHKDNEAMWIKCRRCNVKKLKHKHYFDRLGGKREPTQCKVCSRNKD